jgi:hypothetical protein
LPIVLKTVPEAGYELQEWQDGQGNTITTKNEYDYVMGNAPVSFHAVLGEATDTIIIQEDEKGFCNVDGFVDAAYSGFSGTGYAQTADSSGAGIDWKVSVGLAGNYKLAWRYANGSQDRKANLLINDSPVLTDQSFPGTGSWSTWDTISVELELTSGIKDLRLEAAGDNGLAHIDFLKISGAIVVPVGCSGEEIIDGAIYQIINKGSGKVLEVANASTTNAATVQQNTNTGGLHQQWQLDRIDTDYFTFKAINSGQLMDVYGRSIDNGADIIQWPSNGGTNQNWTVADEGGGWFKITARHSGKCLDVVNGSTADGANVQQWEDNGADAQRWQFVLINDPTALGESVDNIVPSEITLEQNYPNPFNPTTTISYQIPTSAGVELNVYNLLGQKVATLVNEQQSAGNYTVSWNATDFSSGIYIYKLRTGTFESFRKMVLLR